MSHIVKCRQFGGTIKELYIFKKNQQQQKTPKTPKKTNQKNPQKLTQKKADTYHSLGTGQPFSVTVEVIDGESITILTELSDRKIPWFDCGISGQMESRCGIPGLQITL